ncbi:MAG: hypothetical protein JJ850_12405 [Kordiimonadaceae bacterium]|nr:hypothetical protein [Kordiimonadaceae bacterium]MBO6568607.1 hypothetical protein [Kordiimonadaceae bacterium]MBO6965417.1 hypothetical protein [Kordiimonadaceae bacterium]
MNKASRLFGATVLLALVASFSASADLKKIKPPKDKHKLSLSYRPAANAALPRKYDASLGVLPVADLRGMKFYGGEDEYFEESPVDAFSTALYSELKFSQIFRQVRRVNSAVPDRLSPASLEPIAQSNSVDLLLVVYLTEFGLRREKMEEGKKGVDYQINVHVSFFGQLLHPASGTVVWAEEITRDFGSLNTSGKIEPLEYTNNAIEAMKVSFDDMKAMILATGMEMGR